MREGLTLTVDQIVPNELALRREPDPGALEQLAESIKRWGQLQPVVVRGPRRDGKYELICGERRWRAHVLAGLQHIWAVERETVDDEVLALALVENLHRAELSHAEKVAALDQVAEAVQWAGLRGTARHLGMDPGWLSRQLAIRRDSAIFAALEAGTIGFGQAAELLRAPEPCRAELIDRVVTAGVPVTTATVRTWVEGARKAPRAMPTKASNRFTAILAELRSVGVPESDEERATLQELMRCAEQLLNERQAEWRELRCLLCGSQAGVVDPRGRLQPQYRGAVQRVGQRLSCGRCGGSLIADRSSESFRHTTGAA